MDQAFEDGYPKVSVNPDTKKVAVTYKLKAGIASAEHPVEIYNIISSGYDECSVTTVLHGHTAHPYGGYAMEADDYGYLKLTDDQEQTKEYSYAVHNYGKGAVYSVVRQDDEISSVPNAVAFEGEEYIETQRSPHMYAAVKNKAGDKVYLWFAGKLDKTSVPDPSCFKIEDINGQSVGNVVSVQIDDTVIDKYLLESCVILNVTGMTSEEEIYAEYTPPTDGSTGLKGAENEPVTARQSVWIRNKENVSNSAYVSADGKYLTAVFDRPLMTFVYFENSVEDPWDDVTVTVNGEKIQREHMTSAVGAEFFSFDIRDLNLQNVDNVKVKLTINGENLKDLAGDSYENEQELTATVAEDAEWEAASYDKNTGTIKVRIKNIANGSGFVRGCGLEIEVDGKVYPVRGFLERDSGYQPSSPTDAWVQHIITAKQLEHIDLDGAKTIKIRGVASDEIPESYTFTSAAGKPLGATDWVDVTINP